VPLLLLLLRCWQLGSCLQVLLLMLLVLLLLTTNRLLLVRLHAVDLGPVLLPRSLLLLLAWRLCVNHHQPTWLPCRAALLIHTSRRRRTLLLWPCLLPVSTAATCCIASGRPA
jgi:hypothetical protein